MQQWPSILAAVAVTVAACEARWLHTTVQEIVTGFESRMMAKSTYLGHRRGLHGLWEVLAVPKRHALAVIISSVIAGFNLLAVAEHGE